MHQVNAAYSNRVTKVLDNTIGSIKSCDDDDAAPPDTSSLVSELESLRDQFSDTLALTLVDDESLRSDIRKFECERFTKNEEFVKLQAKLRVMREEREERRVELETELSELKTVFEEKRAALVKEQELKEKSERSELESQRETFEMECKVLEENRDKIRKQHEDQSRLYRDEESTRLATVSTLKMNIQKISREHATALSTKQEHIESERALLEKHKRRRVELEEHFKRVGRNLLNKKREEDQLKRVCQLEKRAMALLDEGAISLQKLWRGTKERESVTKMKSRKKKKGGKKKGGKKKK